MMKYTLLLALLVSYIAVVCCVKWEDCGILFSRTIYFEEVVVSPETIKITDVKADHSISISVTSILKDYTLGAKVAVNSFLQVHKDGELYVDTLLGDTCNILANNNNDALCPLKPGRYPFTYKYTLPPVPTGNYTVKIVHRENSTEAREIGCLSTRVQVVGLGLDSCSYTSELSTVFSGTARFLGEDQSVIQIGPRGPGGFDLAYSWGTFKSIIASPDLVGYSLKYDNFVWGLSGSKNSTKDNTFEGYVMIGYLPNKTDYENAQLVYQGLFSWRMAQITQEDTKLYVFQSGTFEFVPGHVYPEGFPYPLNLGNLGVLNILPTGDSSSFKISTTKTWCRCNCDIGGVGRDDSLKDDNANSGSSMSGFRKGTIAIAVIGTFLLIVAVIVIVKLRRSKPRPVVYDDADLMDPQKPDYGTMAINDAFEAQDNEFD